MSFTSLFIYDFFVLKGLNLCIPVVDSIKYVQSLKEIAIDVPQQAAISVGMFYILPTITQILFKTD